MPVWFEVTDEIAAAARAAWMPQERHRTPWAALQPDTRETWRRVAQTVLDEATADLQSSQVGEITLRPLGCVRNGER